MSTVLSLNVLFILVIDTIVFFLKRFYINTNATTSRGIALLRNVAHDDVVADNALEPGESMPLIDVDDERAADDDGVDAARDVRTLLCIDDTTCESGAKSAKSNGGQGGGGGGNSWTTKSKHGQPRRCLLFFYFIIFYIFAYYYFFKIIILASTSTATTPSKAHGAAKSSTKTSTTSSAQPTRRGVGAFL